MRGRLFWSLALVGALGWLVLGGSQAHALTFTLTHNGWTYTEDTANQGMGDFVDPNSVDHMYQNWWWLRVEGDNQETPLPALSRLDSPPQASSAVLQTVTAGLRFKFTYTLTGVSASMANVLIEWEVQNLLTTTQTVNLFAYSDFDLNGLSGGDSGVLVSPSTIRYTKGNTAVDVIASTDNLFGYQVDSFANLLNLLNDGSVYNVSNSGLPFGPGDMTSVFQWVKTLGTNEVMRGTLTKVVNLDYTPPPPPGPVIPEPGTWALMLSGLAPVALRLRRKA